MLLRVGRFQNLAFIQHLATLIQETNSKLHVHVYCTNYMKVGAEEGGGEEGGGEEGGRESTVYFISHNLTNGISYSTITTSGIPSFLSTQTDQWDSSLQNHSMTYRILYLGCS